MSDHFQIIRKALDDVTIVLNEHPGSGHHSDWFLDEADRSLKAAVTALNELEHDAVLITRADVKDLVIPCLSVALLGAQDFRKKSGWGDKQQKEYDRLVALIKDLKAKCP